MCAFFNTQARVLIVEVEGLVCLASSAAAAALSTDGAAVAFTTSHLHRREEKEPRGDHGASYGLLLVLWLREDLRVHVGGCTKSVSTRLHFAVCLSALSFFI